MEPKQRIELRPYQQECIEKVGAAIAQGGNAALVVLPCGTGKTVTFAALASRYKSALIIVPKVSLVLQTHAQLLLAGIDAGIVCGSLNKNDVTSNFVIATFQSAMKIERQFDIVIADECHKVDYNNDKSFYFLILKNQSGFRVGFTATPYRGTERIYPTEFWEPPVFEKSIRWAQAMGYVVRAKTFEPVDKIDLQGIKTILGDWDISELSQKIEADFAKLKSQVADVLLRAAKRKHILWVCISTRHADMVAELLEKTGESFKVIHSDSEDDVDKTALPRHIVSVMMFSEGVDIPAIDCVAMLRPTKSPTLMVQVFGRALRPSIGKEDALILDFGQVIRNCGPIDNPFVGEPIGLRTTGEKLEDRGEKMFRCDECGAMNVIPIKDDKVCLDCGFHVKQLVQDKSLWTKADVKASLTSTDRQLFPLKSILYWTKGDQKDRHLVKHVTLTVIVDGAERGVYFRIDNPNFIRDNHKRRYACAANESKMEALIRDVKRDRMWSIKTTEGFFEKDIEDVSVELTLAPKSEAFFESKKGFDKLHGHVRTPRIEKQTSLF